MYNLTSILHTAPSSSAVETSGLCVLQQKRRKMVPKSSGPKLQWEHTDPPSVFTKHQETSPLWLRLFACLLQMWIGLFTDMFSYVLTPLWWLLLRLSRLQDLGVRDPLCLITDWWIFFPFRVACIWSRGACLPAVQSRLWLAQLWENFELSK